MNDPVRLQSYVRSNFTYALQEKEMIRILLYIFIRGREKWSCISATYICTPLNECFIFHLVTIYKLYSIERAGYYTRWFR